MSARHDAGSSGDDPRANSLAALEARARYELDCLAYPSEPWLPPVVDENGRRITAVVVVGAGQSGMATAFAMRREGVQDVVLLDRNAPGDEGPWESFARMPTLRTPKYLTGPDCGIPSLTFRAWYEAQRNEAFADEPTWDDLVRIPRTTWATYLRWLRGFLDIPVRNHVRVEGIEPAEKGFVALRLVDGTGRQERLAARQIVVANGIDGGGAWQTPALARDLPVDTFAHAADPIDFRRLAGARVAVLGVGAAALDNAGAALDAGAREVVLCFRRSEIPQMEVRGWIEHVGFLRAFADLDDDARWFVMRRLLGAGAPPPTWSLERCCGDPRFVLRPGTTWRSLRWAGQCVRIETDGEPIETDFIIFGTGATTRLRLRPELADVAAYAMLWRDRRPASDAGDPMADYPYLGSGFELLERRPGTAPWLSRVRLFNWAATASLGICASSITGLKFGVERLARALVRDLYRESAPEHLARMPWPKNRPSAPE